MTEPIVNGSLSIVVPMQDMTAILTLLWKSRATEPKIGELYEKYKALIPKEQHMHGNLEPEENVFGDKKEDDGEIKWDIEDMKRAYKDAAEQQWDKYAGGQK